jgi:hypothetical protein
VGSLMLIVEENVVEPLTTILGSWHSHVMQ